MLPLKRSEIKTLELKSEMDWRQPRGPRPYIKMSTGCSKGGNKG